VSERWHLSIDPSEPQRFGLSTSRDQLPVPLSTGCLGQTLAVSAVSIRLLCQWWQSDRGRGSAPSRSPSVPVQRALAVNIAKRTSTTVWALSVRSEASAKMRSTITRVCFDGFYADHWQETEPETMLPQVVNKSFATVAMLLIDSIASLPCLWPDDIHTYLTRRKPQQQRPTVLKNSVLLLESHEIAIEESNAFPITPP
jgi:hypothetical protein